MNACSSLLGKYSTAREKLCPVLQESPSVRSELELQAVFYAGEFGLAWTARDGEAVEVIHLGEWNREPGPDFVGALLKINGEEVRGDIELDREDIDWERHGHAANPAFDQVVVHAFFKTTPKRYHTRTSQHRMVVDVLLSAPHARRSPVPHGDPAAPDQANAQDLVEVAAQFRMTQKRGHWLKAVALHGMPEAFFQAFAAGMGYKNNKIPFLLAAQRTGLTRARKSDGEAVLFGIAGFLEAGSFDRGNAEMRSYARGLWDTWWQLRDPMERLQIPVAAWNFSALRPANHPHRRLGALAAMAKKLPALQQAVETCNAREFLSLLAGLDHPFWSHHASLMGQPFRRPCALVGEQRAADLAANILAPAVGGEEALSILRGLKPGSPISKVNRAAEWLGVPSKAPWLQTALARQGLLQVYQDFYPTPAGDVLALVTGGPES